jgi:hypothetical protein
MRRRRRRRRRRRTATFGEKRRRRYRYLMSRLEETNAVDDARGGDQRQIRVGEEGGKK